MSNGFGQQRIPGEALRRVQEQHPDPDPARQAAARTRAAAAKLLRRPWVGRRFRPR